VDPIAGLAYRLEEKSFRLCRGSNPSRSTITNAPSTTRGYHTETVCTAYVVSLSNVYVAGDGAGMYDVTGDLQNEASRI
jgi:hypothetical protein